ncbi:MAG: hypothetical protein U0271_39625 [Polyangiaceae bacterium]
MKYRWVAMADTQRSATATAATLAIVGLACTSCVGLDSGIDYPDVSDVKLHDYLLTPEGDKGGSATLSQFKISSEVCKGLDTRMVTGPLDQEDLNRFFSTVGVQITPRKARDDLYWYEFPAGDKNKSEDKRVVRLRLAILKDRYGASKDLHDSLLQHGPGWWGVRRGNLALLAPKASLPQALQFAIKYKLVCWGMFTFTGADDAYVVAGAYNEF